MRLSPATDFIPGSPARFSAEDSARPPFDLGSPCSFDIGFFFRGGLKAFKQFHGDARPVGRRELQGLIQNLSDLGHPRNFITPASGGLPAAAEARAGRP